MKPLGLIHCPLVFPPRGSKPTRCGTHRAEGLSLNQLSSACERPYTRPSTNSGTLVGHVSGYPCSMTARFTDISEIGYFRQSFPLSNLQREKGSRNLQLSHLLLSLQNQFNFWEIFLINYIIISQNPINNTISSLSFFGW